MAVDLAPSLQLLALAGVLALLPLGWWWLRLRGSTGHAQRWALTLLTLFLTFDQLVATDEIALEVEVAATKQHVAVESGIGRNAVVGGEGRRHCAGKGCGAQQADCLSD